MAFDDGIGRAAASYSTRDRALISHIIHAKLLTWTWRRL